MSDLDNGSVVHKNALFDLLREDPINVGDLVTFLRKYKEDFPDEFHISGTKDQLVDQVRQGVFNRRIEEADVIKFMQEAEENGDQRIFYFVPRSKKILDLCRDGKAIAQLLFGQRWHETQGFPVLTPVRGAYTVADFRVGVRSKPKDWILKVYGTKLTRRQVGRVPTGINSYNIQIKEVLQRSICLARWDDRGPDGLLELRVTLSARKERVPLDVNAIWARLQGAFAREEFEPWDLTVPLRWMLDNQEHDRRVYRLGSVRISDPADGTIAFHPHGDDESVSDAPSRHNAIKDLIKAGSRCKSIVVTWLAGASGEDLKDDLRTYLGPTATNELVIGAGTTGKAIDYVTEKLRHYRKQADISPPSESLSTTPESPLYRTKPIPFDKVRKSYPKLRQIWDEFENWFASEEHRTHFNEVDLFKSIDPTLNGFNLAVALDVLVKDGHLSRSYRLQIPGGEFVSGEFDTWEAIPTKVLDRFGSVTYRAKDLNLITFYRRGVVDV